MFLLVPAYPGCPGSKAVKRSLLLLLLSPYGLYLMDDEYKITKHLGWVDWRKVVVLTVRKE